MIGIAVNGREPGSPEKPSILVTGATGLPGGSNPVPATSFACSEVRGGNGTIHAQVRLPGLRGVLYSRPCAGATGGDIHYLSVCGSGLLARLCLADVAGHGTAVSAAGAEIHAHLRRSVDVIDERKVLDRLNRGLNTRARP